MKSGARSGSAQSTALNRQGVETGGPSPSAGVADVVWTNSPDTVDRAAWQVRWERGQLVRHATRRSNCI